MAKNWVETYSSTNAVSRNPGKRDLGKYILESSVNSCYIDYPRTVRETGLNR